MSKGWHAVSWTLAAVVTGAQADSTARRFTASTAAPHLQLADSFCEALAKAKHQHDMCIENHRGSSRVIEERGMDLG